MTNQCKWCLRPVYIGDKWAVHNRSDILCNRNCERQYVNKGRRSMFFRPQKEWREIRKGEV